MKPGHLKGTLHGNDCRPVAEILSRIGDKWSVMLVMELGQGTRRFSELRRTLHGISQKMLTLSLRGLERDGFITRTVYPTVPPKVEYRLTDLGRELAVPVRALGEFAQLNRARVLEARDRFDEAAETVSGGIADAERLSAGK
ncbi:MAG: transcriptional regulator, HxlR family [Caulobacter sp.]|nr:transcriptional regulator, HxlR family [Caulobacter sp.]